MGPATTCLNVEPARKKHTICAITAANALNAATLALIPIQTSHTLGDPLKDTAGPSLHVVVKLLNTITLAVAPLYLLALLH